MMAKASDKKAATQGPIAALYIKARAGSIRRAGHRFDTDGCGIALDLLTEQQIDALKNDPALIVDECTIDDDAITAAATKEGAAE